MSRMNGLRRLTVVFAAVCLLAGSALGALVENFDGPPPAATPTQYLTPPGPNPAAGPDAGSTGQFLRLVNDVGSQRNGYAFDQTDAGLYSKIVADFDFRLFSPSFPNDPADGFSFMAIPTGTYGTSGNGATAVIGGVEKPNATGVFGIGFDVYQESSGVNDVSAHWNNAQLVNVNLLNSQIDLDQGVFHHARVEVNHTGVGAYITLTLTPDINGTPGTPVTPINNQFIGTMPSFDSRVEFGGRTGGRFVNGDIDNINVQYIGGPNQLYQDFDGGGTPLTPGQLGPGPGPATIQGGPRGNFLRLINDGVNNQRNSIAFDQTPLQAPAGILRVTADFDFRAGGADASADGFSFLLTPSGTYGVSGPGAYDGSWAAENPNVAGIFAIGFTFHPAATTNDVSVHWNGVELSNINIPLAQIDLEAGPFPPGVFHHVSMDLREVIGGAVLDLILTPDIFGIPGAPVQPFANFFVPGLDLYPFRVEFAARSGGLNMSVDLDNISVLAITPEPGTMTLLLLGGIGAVIRRRRRK